METLDRSPASASSAEPALLPQRERRTKVVCTLGPATDRSGVLDELVSAGMNVARLNFSHGDHPDHAHRYRDVRRAAGEANVAVAVLADLQGPKIRLGRFVGGHAIWSAGDTVRITTDAVDGTAARVSTTYGGLAADASAGDVILVDDGKLELVVVDVDAPDVVCRVVHGGPVSNNKGISLPGMNVSAPALSDKDIGDLEYALGLGVDLVALSFVRRASDIDRVHAVMDRVGRRVPVVAKIEKPEAVTNIADIIAAFDAVMIARGDLGVEIALHDVPLVQKDVIQLAREHAKPVIVATQMLDSMIESTRPTRAEVSDVANAVLDGADAVMLSGETSVGAHPAHTVRIMAQIVTAAEADISRASPFVHEPRTRAGVVSYSARDMATRLDAAALVAFTESGDTMRRLARLHPTVPLIAFTPNPEVVHHLALSRAVQAFMVDPVADTDSMIEQVNAKLIEHGLCERGEVVIVIAGSPPGSVGATNLVRVHRVGDSAVPTTSHKPAEQGRG